MKFMYIFNKISLMRDILLKKNINFIYNRLFCYWCNHASYCVNLFSVMSAPRFITSASRYHSRYQSRPSMYNRGLIPRNFAELAEVVPIVTTDVLDAQKNRLNEMVLLGIPRKC